MTGGALDRLARDLARGPISRRQVITRIASGVVAAGMADPMAAAAKKRVVHCKKHHVKCARKCCAPGEVCASVHKGHHSHRACLCPKPKQLCHGTCTDVTHDAHNCGACGHTCPAGQVCSNGACISNCPAGTTQCGTSCVDTTSSSENCGTCGQACAAGDTCVGGTCVQCQSASQCPGQDTTCEFRLCTAGVCGIGIAAIDTACGTGGNMFCDGHGTCVGCNTASECPGTDTMCQSRTCIGGVCGISKAAINTACGAGGAMFCDGNGSCVGCNTASECPGQDSQCATRTCIGGICGISKSSLNTACGTGMFCDGNGTCVECNSASQCPGQDTSCQARTCTSNTCGFSNAASTTSCGSGKLCDGKGHCATGPCTAQNAATVCIGNGGICDTNDGLCGFADGDGPCTQATASTVCRSAACSVDGTCMPAGGCNLDVDCTSGHWCHEAAHTCSAKLANGVPIPSDPGHSPTLNGTCTASAGLVVCASGVCDPTDNKCGYASGDGPCTQANGAVVCRSGSCTVNGTCA